MSNYSQKQRILILMSQNRTHKWWRASDLMELSRHSRDLFVGYEATARLSELTKDLPEVFEIRMDGKFREVRVKWEDKQQWWSKLKPKYRRAIWKEFANV